MRFLQKYAVAVMVVLLMAMLTMLSDSFLTAQNLLNNPLMREAYLGEL